MASVPGASTQFAYTALFGVGALVCFASLLRVRRVDDAETRYGLYGLLVGSGGWSASHAGLFLAPTADLKIGAYMLGLVLGFSTVFSWLYFCSAYTGRQFHRQRDLRTAGVALYLAVVVVKLTNPLHHQYFTATVITDPAVYVDIQQQPFHWVAMGLAYALAGVGLFMLFERFRDAGYDTRALAGLTGVTALPVVVDIVGFTTDELLNVIYAPLGVAAFALGVLFVYEDRFLAVQLTGDVDEAFVFLDDDGRIRDFNDDAARLFPDLEGARGDPVKSVSALAAALADTRETGEAETDEDPLVLDLLVDGQQRHYLLNRNAFSVGQSGIGEVLVFSDVTNIERQRRELQRHNEQLEEFAAGIRHELRNSLQVISARVNAAGSALDSGSVSRARESLEAASNRTGRMSRTVTDLATLAQYGQTVGGTTAVEFHDVVESAWQNAETGELDLEIDGDGTIQAEPGRLQNLFESAFEFARHNESESVTVTLTERGFTVTDDGTRPADENLDLIFDYGEAVPNADAGMALPNVETLVEVHGWSLGVDEEYEDGVRLVVEGANVERAEQSVA